MTNQGMSMSTRSLNKVMLIGNLTRDPELRYTSKGTAVCNFGLATNRYWVTDEGEKKEEVEFHRIVAWNKLAELCSQLLAKGRKAYVEGRFQTRSWTGSDGQERTTNEVVISRMIVLDFRGGFKKKTEKGAGEKTAEEPEIDISEEESSSSSASSSAKASEDEKASEDKEKKEAKGSEKSKSGGDKTAKKGNSAKKADNDQGEEKVNPDEIPF